MPTIPSNLPATPPHRDYGSLHTEAINYAGLSELETAATEAEKAEAVAGVIFGVFKDYYSRSRAMPAIAKAAFEQMDWSRALDVSRERLTIYSVSVEKIAPLLTLFCPEIEHGGEFWDNVRRRYETLIQRYYQADLAFAFLNSVRRKIHQDQWRAVEYSYGEAHDPGRAIPEIVRRFQITGAITPATVREILQVPGFAVDYADQDTDAGAVAGRINGALKTLGVGAAAAVTAEIIDAGFYRNRGAYIVGRLCIDGGACIPLAIALLNEDGRIFVDAVVLDSDHLQYVFSSTLANFHVTSAYYHELSNFLHSLMPKRPLGLHYSTIGFHHVGKVTVMRQLEDEHRSSGERLERAVGFPGTVAIGFSARSSDYVLKVIRNRPTRNYKWGSFAGIAAVLNQYRRVHEINRTGSMLDNVIYYNVLLPEGLFSPAILDELVADASENVSLNRHGILFKHLIVQMKMIPLPVFLETASRSAAETAIASLGQCIKNNAAANIFNKDLDGRNYGVSKILKVYLFDYDALEPLTEVKVRTNLDRIDGEEDVPDWFFEDGFIFLPEELTAGLRIDDRDLRRRFHSLHGDLLTVDYWTAMQRQLAEGRVPRISTYPEACRIARGQIASDL